MSMPPSSLLSLRDAVVGAAGSGSVFGLAESVSWRNLVAGTVLGNRGDELCGRSVLLAASSQFTAAAALVELDGLARRIVLYPPDLSLAHADFVTLSAGVDAIISDRITSPMDGALLICPSSWTRKPEVVERAGEQETEWVLLTSGSTGRPKLVVHTLASLTRAMIPGASRQAAMVWSTFYDIRRYGGLQIFLRAALGGTSLVLSNALESTAQFLARAGSHKVSHISGTPSHWRRALMSSAAHLIDPEYVRLSGEIADQAILDQLQRLYPRAKVVHAFASTEAGLAFEVNDGLMGFAADVLNNTAGVEMKVENRSLRIRSGRTARCYLGSQKPPLKDEQGFVDTGDALESRGDRYYFVGRADGVINVGGMKVHPEEVEAVINSHPSVDMSLVRTKKNPITGALVIADVVLKTSREASGGEIGDSILRLCRQILPPHKVPAAINFVPSLAIAESGKLIRLHA